VPTVAVLGAGIIGAAVADRLARSGASVTVVDSRQPGRQTSGSSFAWLNANQKLPRHYHDLSVRAMAEWAALAADLAGPSWYVPTGSLTWADADEQRAELTDRLTRLRDWDYPAADLTARQAADLEPSLRVPAAARVAFFPSEGFVHGDLAADALLHRARSAGARLVRTGGDVRLDRDGDRVTGVRLPGAGRLHADVYVCCAGWRTTALLEPVGLTVPLVPAGEPGSTAPCVVTSVGGRTPLRRVVHAPRVNLRPASGGGLHLEAGDVNDRVDAGTADLDAYGRELRDRAAQLIAGAPPDGASWTRLCIRPLPVDGHPIAGRLPAAANAYVVVTHSGMTLAPLLGRLVAADILCDDGAELAPYRPGRFTAA
jgi:glycine/D-amino acid oxidase-like deaminating enzyme